MSYLVLARKYRPQVFDDVVGQEHATRTLRNAFRQNKVGQAYLFTGTRGVGKTSLSRIVAKALRCEHPEHQPGQSNYGIPCNLCESCREVGQAHALDVIEIDGASNNGVDSVREIRDQVRFLPTRGRTKVYIIDEVHMLTGAAFNALLKTLEEPPAHITFLFATTEVQKVPATILSRCQRFDLKRVPAALISDYLVRICQSEKLQADSEALHVIARKADGSIRDSLSLLDQVIAHCGDRMDSAGVAEALGTVRSDLVFSALTALLEGQPLAALAALETSLDSGSDAKSFAIELAQVIRNVVLIKLGGTKESVGVLASEFPLLSKISEQSTLETLEAIFVTLSQGIAQLQRSPLPKASLELLLIRCSHLSDLESFQSIAQRLQQLEDGQISQRSNNPSPQRMAQKMSASPLTPVAQPTPAPIAPESLELTWRAFVQLVTRTRPSIGSLLEHAIPVTDVAKWRSPDASLIRIGFRENQAFYRDQAKSAMFFPAIERLVSEFAGGPKRVEIDILATEPAATKNAMGGKKESAARPMIEPATLAPKAAVPVKTSISETRVQNQMEKAEQLKKLMLEQEIVQHTREILGAELTSFDITDKS